MVRASTLRGCLIVTPAFTLYTDGATTARRARSGAILIPFTAPTAEATITSCHAILRMIVEVGIDRSIRDAEVLRIVRTVGRDMAYLRLVTVCAAGFRTDCLHAW